MEIDPDAETLELAEADAEAGATRVPERDAGAARIALPFGSRDGRGETTWGASANPGTSLTRAAAGATDGATSTR